MSNILEDSIFILPESVTKSTISSIKSELLEYINKNDVITLDGCIVDDIDAFGLQLLLSAHKICYLESKEFSIIDVSNKFRKVLEITGFLELIDNE